MKISAIRFYSNKNTKQNLAQHNIEPNNVNFSGINFPQINFSIAKPEPKKFDIPLEYLEKELEYSNLARKANIDTPQIDSFGKYYIHGNPAHPNKNPIRPIHIKNILKNIEKLDRSLIFHGDLEQGHMFYNKDGSIEIDCFRFASNMQESKDRLNWEFPKTYMASNLYDFENNCLGEYLSKMNNKEKEDEFIKQYLILSSKLHQNNAIYLKSKNAPLEQINFEKLQAKLYKNPDKDLIEITKDRINFKYKARNAFTEWDEGNGACGHKKDETRTQKGIDMFFSAWIDSIELQMNISSLINEANSSEKTELLSYLNQYAKHWDNNYAQSIAGMANWMINPENPNNETNNDINEKLIENFNYMYNKATKCKKMSEKKLLIDATKTYFNLMIKRDEHI